MPKRHKNCEKRQACTTSKKSIADPRIPKHVLSQLGFDSDLPEYNEYCERLIGLINKPFDVDCLVDWDPLNEFGLDVTVKDMLRQQYSYGKKTYYYQEWQDLINLGSPIYQELCWEFHSTYVLKEEPESIKDKEFMRFRLGGVNRQMSLEDFTRCLKIYSPKQMDEPHFSDYIWSGARVSAMNNEEFNASKVWEEFSSVSCWSPGNVSYLSMDDVRFRLIHLFMTRIIFHRTEDTDTVTLSDLWYLEQIRSKTRVNIPYCVAYHLKHFAATGGQTICGGRFVTLIADHLRMEIDKGIKKVTFMMRFINHSCYANANVISKPDEEETEVDVWESIFEMMTRIEELQLQQEKTLLKTVETLGEHQEWTLSADLSTLSERIAKIEKLSQIKLDEIKNLSQIEIPSRIGDMENVSRGRQQVDWRRHQLPGPTIPLEKRNETF